MFYVSIIDHTNKKILYAEEYESKEDATRRRGLLDAHCELCRDGSFPEMDPKANFETYLSEERAFAFPTPEEEQAALTSQIRGQRNGLLSASDWTELPGSPLSDKLKAAWANYRQALRDVPQEKGFPTSVDWPVAPGA